MARMTASIANRTDLLILMFICVACFGMQTKTVLDPHRCRNLPENPPRQPQSEQPMATTPPSSVLAERLSPLKTPFSYW
jgi:hypothetical protein